MARKTEVERRSERGRLFLRELHGQRLGTQAEVTAVMVGDAIGLDALEVVLTMGWLIERELVTEVGVEPSEWLDPYTSSGLALTDLGMRFLETGEIP